MSALGCSSEDKALEDRSKSRVAGGCLLWNFRVGIRLWRIAQNPEWRESVCSGMFGWRSGFGGSLKIPSGERASALADSSVDKSLEDRPKSRVARGRPVWDIHVRVRLWLIDQVPRCREGDNTGSI